MSEPQHPDILIRLMHFCVSPDMFVREEISGGYVRDMLRDARDEIDRLRAAIRRLADQDATLSVCNGNVTVQMDATPEILEQLSQRGGPLVPFDPPQPTLTDAEREAVEWFSRFDRSQNGPVIGKHAATLRGLLERLGGER